MPLYNIPISSLTSNKKINKHYSKTMINDNNKKHLRSTKIRFSRSYFLKKKKGEDE